MKKGFDSEVYLKVQTEKIEERIKMFDKLYLEFGGKIFDDYHASRVLPGFEPDIKIKLLEKLKDQLEVIFCINANDIEKSKMRADYGISYEMELIRLIDNLSNIGISINSVVVTMYTGQKTVKHLEETLKNKNIKLYIHTPIEGYPNDIETIVSDKGYGKNPYVETTKKLVIVTAPGPNSGKLGTALSQLYPENKRGVKAGYAKFETFPVWDLNLMHPVNVAYEAATADLGDVNMIDSFHLEAYNKNAVNYNRDISTFPILKNILQKITGKVIYQSPTDMGVNMISKCITDDSVVREAANMEIIRRYYNALSNYKQELCSKEEVERIEILMNRLNLSKEMRRVANVALEIKEEKKSEIVALELENGKIVTGKETELLSATSAMLINALKEINNIPDDVHLLSTDILEKIFEIKKSTSYRTSYCLNVQEVLIALSVCSSINPIIEKTLKNLELFHGTEAHSTYIIEKSEMNILKSLGVNLTCEARL